MVIVKDVKLVIKTATIPERKKRALMKRLLAQGPKSDEDNFTASQLDFIFDGQPKLRKLFTPG
jgi:hypothetical protein